MSYENSEDKFEKAYAIIVILIVIYSIAKRLDDEGVLLEAIRNFIIFIIVGGFVLHLIGKIHDKFFA